MRPRSALNLAAQALQPEANPALDGAGRQIEVRGDRAVREITVTVR
jgi:hypothetical protein